MDNGIALAAGKVDDLGSPASGVKLVPSGKGWFGCCASAELIPTYDLVIVGAGFGGAYTAYQFKKKHPDASVLILEKSCRVGGRLMSDDNDEDNDENKDELGGMRIFPSVQKNVADLLTKELGLTLTAIPLDDGVNWFYHGGERVRKREFRIRGLTPNEFVQVAWDKFKAAEPAQASLEPMHTPEMRGLSLRDFLTKYGATPEEVDKFFSYSGYDIFSSHHVQASIFFHEGKLYGPTLSEDQRFVKEGFQTAVERMVERSGATLECASLVLAMRKGPAGVVVEYRGAHAKNLCVNAAQVVCALPQDGMTALSARISCISAERKRLIKEAVVTVPLFKCFLEWAREEGKQQWWIEHGFVHGKSTTDLEIRQAVYYDNEDILVYNSGKYATFWDKEFTKDPKQAARKIYEQIKQVHGLETIPEPDYDSTIFKYWVNGSHKWAKGVDIDKAMHAISNGLHDKSRVHICGDAFSRHQGWVAGVMETADMVLERLEK